MKVIIVQNVHKDLPIQLRLSLLLENTDKYTYEYTWTKDDESAEGLATSVKDLATDIFNNLTGNKHIEHQLKYKQEYKWITNIE